MGRWRCGAGKAADLQKAIRVMMARAIFGFSHYFRVPTHVSGWTVDAMCPLSPISSTRPVTSQGVVGGQPVVLAAVERRERREGRLHAPDDQGDHQ